MSKEKMTSLIEYYNKFQGLQNGTISEVEWEQFTAQVFAELLEENKEVFERFQNEWAK